MHTSSHASSAHATLLLLFGTWDGFKGDLLTGERFIGLMDYIFAMGVRVEVRVKVGREICNVSDLGIELGDGVCVFERVPPDQPCPSAKEADRFTRSILQMHAHTQGCHDYV